MCQEGLPYSPFTSQASSSGQLPHFTFSGSLRDNDGDRMLEAGGKLGIWVTQEKTGRRLFIVFSQRLCRILEDAERASEFIICNNKTGEQLAYTGIEQAVRKLRHKLGIKKTIHDWRHTTAHRLASAGCDIERIQAITGHTNSAMVRRYANETLQINQAVKAIDALDALDVF